LRAISAAEPDFIPLPADIPDPSERSCLCPESLG
jgi:hypothetical protein